MYTTDYNHSGDMMKPTTIEDFININETVKTNDEIKDHVQRWETLFEKYSKLNEREEDGINLDDLIKSLEEEKLNDFSDSERTEGYLSISDEEEFVENTIEPEETLTTMAKFHEMSQKERFQQLSQVFAPDLLLSLMDVFKKKAFEAERLSLLNWNVTFKRTSVVESFEENTSFSGAMSTKLFNRSAEMNQFDLQLSKFHFKTNSGSNDLPPLIERFMKKNENFMVKIREREYVIKLNRDMWPTPEESIMSEHAENSTSIYVASSASEDEGLLSNEMIKDINVASEDVIEITDEDQVPSNQGKSLERKDPPVYRKKKLVMIPVIAPLSGDEKKVKPERVKPKKNSKKKLKPEIVNNLLQKPDGEHCSLSPSVDLLTEELPEVINDTTEITKPFKTLTIDDISCGSSCASDSSSDGEFFVQERYEQLRAIKKLEHKKKKLLNRKEMNNCKVLNQPNSDDFLTKSDSSFFTKKCVDKRGSDEDSPWRECKESPKKIRRVEKNDKY